MSSDKRHSYRYRVQEEFTQATVLTGRKEWPAELVNESAGGFLVATTSSAGVKPGDSITLRIHSGSYLTEVVHVRPEGEKVHLGVRRFDDDLQPQPRSFGAQGWRGAGKQQTAFLGQGFLMFGAYAGLALLSAAFVLWGDPGRSLRTWFGGEAAQGHGPALAKLPDGFSAPSTGAPCKACKESTRCRRKRFATPSD